MRASEFLLNEGSKTPVVENTNQAAVDALMKKYGWSMGRTANGDLAFTWQGSKYEFFGERVRITLPDGKSISVVWNKKPDWQGRGNDELSFAQAVQNKYLTFDLPIWQALNRGQLTDRQAIQKFKAENERQAREAVAQGQLGVAEGATVTRIDSKPITDFGSSLKAYKHTDDWSQSGVDTGDDSYWKNKNLKTNTTKGLFAGDPKRTALYATGNAHETRYVEFTQDGQPIVYFDRKDLPAMRSRKTYLTVFDASDFRQLPTGEWFSQNPSKPIKQVPIGDPFKYIASQGWIVRVTDDLDKVFNQVKNMHKAGKIAQYGAEGMNESKQGVAEDLTEVVDLDTAFPLKWDQQFAAQGEIHASATDADGREIGISFTPAGNGEITDVAFTRGGTHEMTGKGDAGRVMATVIKAINIYANKYKPPYLAFSAKSSGGRAGAYTAMIRRYAQGYELLPADRYPAALNNYIEFIGTDQPFVLART